MDNYNDMPQYAPEQTQEAQMQQGGEQQQYAVPVSQQAQPPQITDEMYNEQVAQAKEALGINRLINELQYKDNLAEAVSNNPELSKAVIEAELAKIEKNDPEFAKQIKTSKTGFDIFVKGIKSSITPKEKADEITDDSQSGNFQDADPTLERIKKGTADLSTLGAYINGLAENKK